MIRLVTYAALILAMLLPAVLYLVTVVPVHVARLRRTRSGPAGGDDRPRLSGRAMAEAWERREELRDRQTRILGASPGTFAWRAGVTAFVLALPLIAVALSDPLGWWTAAPPGSTVLLVYVLVLLTVLLGLMILFFLPVLAESRVQARLTRHEWARIESKLGRSRYEPPRV